MSFSSLSCQLICEKVLRKKVTYFKTGRETERKKGCLLDGGSMRLGRLGGPRKGGNLGFFFSSPSFSGLMPLTSKEQKREWLRHKKRQVRSGPTCSAVTSLSQHRERKTQSIFTALTVTYFDLGQVEVDAFGFWLQAPRLLHLHPQVFHVGEDHVLHCAAVGQHKTTTISLIIIICITALQITLCNVHGLITASLQSSAITDGQL